MMLSDNFFKKVESKTNVDKNTIVNLAAKLQKSNFKDEATLKEVIHELGKMAGKTVSKEQEEKIISTIVHDKVPKDIEKIVDTNYNQ